MSTTTQPATTGRSARPNGGVAGLLAVRIVTEVRSVGRSIEFVIGAVGVPVILFAMFGLPNAQDVLPGDVRVSTMMMVSFCAYGAISLALFTFGDDVAKERGRGWFRTLRATPLPIWVHLAGKLAVAAVYMTAIVVVMGAVGVLFGSVSLPAATWVAVWAVNVAGVLAFSTLGFAVAFTFRPKAATALANLLFLPLSFFSGFFFPLSELPAFLSDIAPWLPTYHFGRLAWAVLGSPEAVEAWVGLSGSPIWVHVAWVLGSAVIFGSVALFAARRERVSARG